MPIFKWTPDYSVGVSAMDEQHIKLFDIINRLHDSMRSGEAQEGAKKVTSELVEYTKTHFGAEERFMASKNYPRLEDHKKVHASIIARIQDFQTRINEGRPGVAIELATFLKDWLIDHIQKTDKRYGEFVNS